MQASDGPNGSSSGPLLLAGALFSSIELQAMAADGLLHQVYRQAYVPSGTRETGALRALALRHAVPAPYRERVVIGWFAAAWIYGCGPPPGHVDVLADRSHRVGALKASSGCRLHEVPLLPGESLRLDGVEVSSPLRTALDIALYGAEEPAVAALTRLTSRADLHCPLGRVRSALENSGRRPGKHKALDRLRRVLQEVEMRQR